MFAEICMSVNGMKTHEKNVRMYRPCESVSGNICIPYVDDNLVITYNFLNLPKEIKKSGTVVSKYAYLSDGKKVSSCDADGNGYMYFGTARFTLDNNVPTFESIPFSSGRIVKTTNGYEPQYYLTDHLGSTRMIVNKDGQTVEATFDYTPFGVQITGASLPTNSTEYRFSGKELQNISDYEIYDFGARQYFPKYAVWGSSDPLSEMYYPISPYAYCANNPVNLIDPDGRMFDWYETLDDDLNKQIKYTELTSQQALDNAGINGRYLGQVVVIFDGSYSEKLGEGGYLNKDGAVLAEVTVYGPNGENDISQYPGFTMTSNFEKFGAIADGEYNVSHVKANPDSAIPKTHIINNGDPVDCVNGVNPSPKEYKPYSSKQKNGIYVHRSNNSGWAGDNPNKCKAVSSGCLLIPKDYWASYDNQINKHNYKLILRRTK